MISTVYGIQCTEYTLCHAVYGVYSTGCCIRDAVYGMLYTGCSLQDTFRGILSTGYILRDVLYGIYCTGLTTCSKNGYTSYLYYKFQCLLVCLLVCLFVCLSFESDSRSSSKLMKTYTYTNSTMEKVFTDSDF